MIIMYHGYYLADIPYERKKGELIEIDISVLTGDRKEVVNLRLSYRIHEKSN